MKKLILVFSIFLAGCGAGSGEDCTSAPAHYVGVVESNADAAFRAKFQSGEAVTLAIVGDSTTFGSGQGGAPNAVQLLDAYVKSINPASTVYNYGVGGYRADDHIRVGTIGDVSILTQKPDVVVIALGINSATYRLSQLADLKTLVGQVRQYGMLPVLAYENNISCTNPYTAFPFWKFTRGEVTQAAIDTLTDVIDLGSPDGMVNPALMYDQYHPNGLGYKAIFEKYIAWLSR
jgi:lysophospholipase L1-like esterase